MNDEKKLVKQIKEIQEVEMRQVASQAKADYRRAKEQWKKVGSQLMWIPLVT